MDRQLADPTIDPNNTAEIWNKWEASKSEHDNMTQSYIGDIVSALKAIYGDRYSKAEYEAIAWIGLGNINGENVKSSAWVALTIEKKASLKSTFENVNSNCDGDSCKN